MKRLIPIFCAACLVLCFPALPAFAADGDTEPSNVTITVVVPGAEPKPEESPRPASSDAIGSGDTPQIYPSDVTEIRDGGDWLIIKTYELSADEKPEDIPRDSFERSAGTSGTSWLFTLTDITRKETANAETREHTETVTLDTDTKDLDKILTMLSQTLEYTTEDGFSGVLSLDVASIAVETSGTKSSSYTMSVTREYPRLSAKDLSFVPKTVEDKGKTYTLANVDWKVGNYSTVDYEQIPDYYTAVATYTATGTSTKVTGYTITAVYNGTLAKMSQGKTYYTAFFLGEESSMTLNLMPPAGGTADDPNDDPMPADDQPVEEPTNELAEGEHTSTSVAEDGSGDTPDANHNGALIAILICGALIAGGAYFLMKRKGKNTHEKTRNSASVTDDDGGDDDSGVSR